MNLLVEIKIGLQFPARMMQRHLIVQSPDFRELHIAQACEGKLAGQRLQRPHDRKNLVDIGLAESCHPRPRLGRRSSNPSLPSTFRASRSGVRETPIMSHSRCSGTRSPPRSSPAKIISRRRVTSSSCSVVRISGSAIWFMCCPPAPPAPVPERGRHGWRRGPHRQRSGDGNWCRRQ